MKTSHHLNGLAKRLRPAGAAALALALLFVVALPLAVSRAADPPLVVIVAATSPLQDISRGALRRAFLGEPTGGPGGRLIPLNQPPATPARTAFDKAVLGLEGDAVAQFWIDQRIRGQAGAPRAIPTALLPRVVSQLAGAIGYVRLNEVAAGVKVVTIDGKKPGDRGYPLP